MKKEIKVYVAGKVTPSPYFNTSFWRYDFCRELEEKSRIKIINLDPMSRKDLPFDPDMVFGRDSFLIKNADLVIVNLTDDVSVGASQEILIAKYFNKPVLGITRKEGKFVRTTFEEYGKTVNNYVHPFVHVTCDGMVHDINDAAEWIRNFFGSTKESKKLDIIDISIDYYLKHYYQKDKAAQGYGL